MPTVDDLLIDIKQDEAKALEQAMSEFADLNEQLTFGPDESTLSGAYSAGDGVWDIHFMDAINSDVLLILQSRMKQLYLRTNRPNQAGPIPRRVKDLLFKDFFPVHLIRS